MRKAAVSGQFYPGTRHGLLAELGKLLPQQSVDREAIGAVCPHAGYIYSGAVAGKVFSRLKPRSTYIILSPNHTGEGARYAASREPWQTPLGTIEVDNTLLGSILDNTPLVSLDPSAHLYEHSCEVQVPFVQVTSPEAKIVPITIQQGPIREIEAMAEAIALAVKETRRDAVIIASSDMTHYESRRSASKKDKEAIEKVLALDGPGLMHLVEERDISMCGYVPVAMMLMAARRLGASKGELVDYKDSGDVTGDTDEVVGYAGILVY